MEEDQKHKHRVISVNLNGLEYENVMQRFSMSGCYTISEYCRKMLLSEPIVLYYRNKSFDEFVQEAILLRNEIQFIRGQLPINLEKAGQLIKLQEDIKECINKIVDTCLPK